MKIGFISDIHEDFQSLISALNLFERLKCDLIVCLGDIVGSNIYHLNVDIPRDANYCVFLVEKSCAISVIGNHDLFAIKKLPVYNSGFDYPDNWYTLDSQTRIKLSRNKLWLYDEHDLPIKLNDQSVNYLNSLQEFVVYEINGIKFMFSHFNFPDLSGSTINFPKKIKNLEEHFLFMKENDCLIGVSGHGHIEGCAIASKDKLEFKPFGSYKLNRELQWIVTPCIVNSKRRNGIMIFDTLTFKLDVIPLNKY